MQHTRYSLLSLKTSYCQRCINFKRNQLNQTKIYTTSHNSYLMQQTWVLKNNLLRHGISMNLWRNRFIFHWRKLKHPPYGFVLITKRTSGHSFPYLKCSSFENICCKKNFSSLKNALLAKLEDRRVIKTRNSFYDWNWKYWKICLKRMHFCPPNIILTGSYELKR